MPRKRSGLYLPLSYTYPGIPLITNTTSSFSCAAFTVGQATHLLWATWLCAITSYSSSQTRRCHPLQWVHQQRCRPCQAPSVLQPGQQMSAHTHSDSTDQQTAWCCSSLHPLQLVKQRYSSPQTPPDFFCQDNRPVTPNWIVITRCISVSLGCGNMVQLRVRRCDGGRLACLCVAYSSCMTDRDSSMQWRCMSVRGSMPLLRVNGHRHQGCLGAWAVPSACGNRGREACAVC